MIIHQAIQTMNALGQRRSPFLFIIDFEMRQPIIIPNPFEQDRFLFEINGLKNHQIIPKKLSQPINLDKFPIPFAQYEQAFNYCKQQMKYGNSYLLNLTFPTRIDLNLSLSDVFHHSKAKYKLLNHNKFVCFSPETFIQIKDGIISSNPMKGTISTQIQNAEQVILNNKKEMAEHNTIVDFIRNDLNMVAKKVHVERFRYIDRIQTNEGELLQVSSKITGQLPDDYLSKIGDILIKLLPGGSISGAPKQKTLEIIRQAEQYKRGYYTGVFGYFDGQNLDSAVMIRFIEKKKQEYFFKSGGGITYQSKAKEEYQELIDKVYLPIIN